MSFSLGLNVKTNRDHWIGKIVGFNKKTNSIIVLNNLWGLATLDKTTIKKLGDIDPSFLKKEGSRNFIIDILPTVKTGGF